MAQPTVARATHIHPIGLQQVDLMAPTPSSRPPDDPHLASENILRSKVQAPVVRESTLARGRLLGWLDEHAQERVCVIAAEAGYGKSTLLADWARRVDRPVRWLKLDPTDAEWTTFISYLVAAFREGDPNFGQATQRLLAHVATLGTTLDQATSQFLGELGAALSEPSVLIVDDLQHVQGSTDVQRILERLIERAPESLTFILSGRNRPDLRLGRLTAQGKVIGLGTEDLRFTRQETGDLFALGYRMPLDGDLVTVVDTRTEGWGASLQLLYSSIRSQRPAEVREFIRGLAGNEEPLYDFLAEEVLDRQTPLMQRVLLHAAILDRIVPPLVVAALGATDDPPAPDLVIDALEAADELGLMSRNAQRSSSRRFHPLLREFLSSHLKVITPTAVLKQMHLKVAQAAETIHWPTSAHHYIEADDGHEAMRVISDASFNALGTGAWGPAMELLDRIPEIPPTTSVQVLRARRLVALGSAAEAIRLLNGLTLSGLAGQTRSLIRLALAGALSNTDEPDAVLSTLQAIIDDEEAPPFLAAIASSWHQMYVGTNPAAVAQQLVRVADQAESTGLHLYAGVASHNAAAFALAAGLYDTSIREATRALALFSQAADDTGNAASSHMTIANAAFELGDFQRCTSETSLALLNSAAQPDVFAEAAVLQTWLGFHKMGAASVSQGSHALAGRDHLTLAPHEIQVAYAWVSVAAGDLQKAAELLSLASSLRFDRNHHSLLWVCRASIAALTEEPSKALATVDRAMKEVGAVGAARWTPHLRLTRALVAGDEDCLAALFHPDFGISEPLLLASADVVANFLDVMPSIPVGLERAVRKHPERWRPPLRRKLASSRTGSEHVTATMLAEIGQIEDIDVLHRWERLRKVPGREARLSVMLARRVSPTLRIADLGRSVITVGGRQVRVAEVRRKAASLLLFLVSRPRQTATREQVFDALWPDMDSAQAANSLHQTLYFLRRELVARPEDGKPLVAYVPVESELVYLDSEVVHIESVAFARQARELIGRDSRSPEVVTLLQSYSGRFAPEFEYEDWAIDWRDQTHSAFLNLTEQAARSRLPMRAPEAAAILGHALEVDPGATELKPLAAAALHLSGSQAAARLLYDRYVEECVRDFGEAPSPLEEVLATLMRGQGTP